MDPSPNQALDLHSAWSRLPRGYEVPAVAPSLPEAQAYCARLARGHYENFNVVSWFLPKRLHQHFFNVYSYCRISDDLGDEVGETHLSLALLNLWQGELDACYAHIADPAKAGSRHPVFIALEETIREFGIPHHEFSDLLIAFREDQTKTRYETFDEVLHYCKNSANPVGHLVLYLCGYSDAERQQLSDYTCTALQLANHWQDVARDYDNGRVYLPQESLRRFGVSESDIAQRRFTKQFGELMKFEVARAREWFDRGLPLVQNVDRQLALDIDLFSRGGQAILNAIERQGYDVLKSRPVISKPRKLALLFRALIGKVA